MSEYDFDPSDDAGNNVKERGSNGNQSWLGDGKHIVTIVKHELGEASTGSSYIEFWFENDAGQSHNERFSLVAAARWKLASMFKAVGFTAKINLSQNGMVKKALYNKRFQINIGQGKPNERTGKTYREIRFFDPAPTGSERTTARVEREPARDPHRGNVAPPPDDGYRFEPDGDIPF